MLNFRTNSNKINELVKSTKTLESMLAAQQQTIDILYTSRTSGKKYRTRKAQVEETRRKYRGGAEFGNQILQRLVNLRVAFSMPNRLFLIKNQLHKETSEQVLNDTKEFLTAFMELNGLDSSLPRDLAKEAEMQGSVALRLVWDPNAKLPRLKYYPWDGTGYEVKPVTEFLINGKNTLSYTGADGSKVKLNDRDFVFIAFNDELNCFEGYPTCGGILETIENLDKDLLDWRLLNHLFAHPTPHFKCESSDEADKINAELVAKGWKTGTAIATNSEFKLAGTTGVEANLLMLSITTNAKIISGHSGIAIHYLGFANVMNAKATADGMGEPTEIVLQSEINSWNTFYASLFAKAIQLRNSKLNGELPTNLVLPKIVPLTDRQWDIIKNIWMPLAAAGNVSSKTLLEKIPGLDVDAEMERIKDQEKVNAEKMKAQEKDNQEKLNGGKPGVNNQK